ncbi:putative metal-dependent hydrolase (urease superfamily) [Thermoplasmatales archaeon BRNA1]|nr:putative metal-dependent hydrolase (urease superfamily) [Thermoplasmatales archaeon BRNA1]
MDRVPAYDDHFHMSPRGRNVEALKEFEAEGGTGITLVTLPYPEVRIRSGADFAESYKITYDLAQLSREQTSVEVNVAVGPYPILLVSLAEEFGLEEAEAMMIRGMDDAAKAIQEGKAVAIGEVGRPHFECPDDIWDASNRVLLHGMQLAKENDVPVIIHCENADDTDLSLSRLAARAGLDPSLVIKHSSLPLVTEEETHGVMPSIPASKKYIKEALAKGTDRFMLETDYIDDPAKPTSIMACTTVPNKVKWMLASGTCSEESIMRICSDLPNRYYHR